jgi:hypothetical protein
LAERLFLEEVTNSEGKIMRKPFASLLFLVLLLLFVGCAGTVQTLNPGAFVADSDDKLLVSLALRASYSLAQDQDKSELPYHLLGVDKDQIGPNRFLSYYVSVDQRLDSDEMKKLVCRVLRKEPPKEYERLSVRIYFRATDYRSEETLESFRRVLGSYHWKAELINYDWTLHVVQDKMGNPITVSVPFDHQKDCGSGK